MLGGLKLMTSKPAPPIDGPQSVEDEGHEIQETAEKQAPDPGQKRTD